MKKIDVKDLDYGMYVSQLDRPWLESPFLFQGFVIDAQDELRKLQEICEYVFIDEEKSVGEDTLKRDSQGAAPSSPNPDAREFADNFRATLQTHQQLNFGLIKLIDDRRLGQMVDAAPVRAAVSGLIGNVLSNQNAAIWLTKLREEDEFTAIHGINVSILALAFAQKLGYDADSLEAIGLGAVLHDIGLTEQSSEIIRKKSELTEDEFAIVRKHPVDGLFRLKNAEAIPQITKDIIRWHHERLDGTGYPDQLFSEATIPEHVRIVAIADTYDAMTSDRVYRSAILPSDALTEMLAHAEDTFGRELVQSFIQCVGIYPVGSAVRLNTGAMGIITASSPESRLKPLVLLVKDAEGKDMAQHQLVDLALASRKAGQQWSIESVINPREHGIDLKAIAESELKLLK